MSYAVYLVGQLLHRFSYGLTLESSHSWVTGQDLAAKRLLHLPPATTLYVPVFFVPSLPNAHLLL